MIRSRVSYPTVVVISFCAKPGKDRDFDVTIGIDLSAEEAMARGSHGGAGDPMGAETQTATLLAMTQVKNFVFKGILSWGFPKAPPAAFPGRGAFAETLAFTKAKNGYYSGSLWVISELS